MGGVCAPPLEANVDLPDFTPEHVHVLFQGVYGYFPHPKHMHGLVADDTIWKHRWCRLATQLSIWYATPSGTVGCRFTAILEAE